MRLYLVRHGDAEPTHPDVARKVSPAGRAQVHRLADLAAAEGLHVDEIRHSGLARARETAEILAAKLQPPLGVVEMAGLRPDDDVDDVAIELGVTDGSLLIVSHMPFVARLAGRLMFGRRSPLAAPFATAELRGLERDDGTWRAITGFRG